MRVGVTHDAITWIRKHLNLIGEYGSKLNSLSPQFDYALKRRVIAFQREHKLGTDGIVGERTMLALQALSGEKPLLYSVVHHRTSASVEK
jgi:general secretion pathway protein A